MTPDEPHSEHPAIHGALVKRFAAGLKPRRPLWPVGMRLSLWTAVVLGIFALVAARAGHDLLLRLKQPSYDLEVLFFAAAATLCASQALRSAIPGRVVRAREFAPTALLISLSVAILVTAAPMNTSYRLGEFIRVGLPCAASILTFGLLPWVMLWWMVQRAAPLRGGLSGMLAGGASFFSSFAILRLGCPLDEPLHLLTWHLLPALGAITLSALAGRVWLRLRLPAKVF